MIPMAYIERKRQVEKVPSIPLIRNYLIGLLLVSNIKFVCFVSHDC